MTAGEGVAVAGGVRSAHARATAAVGGRAAGFAGDTAERQQLAGGRAPFRNGDAELAAAVGVVGAGLSGGTTARPCRCAEVGHAGAVATVAVGGAAGAGGRTGRLAAVAVHASERATIARSGAGLSVGRAADGVEADEIAAARRIDPAEERATVGVEVTGGTLTVAEGERRAAPGGAEARTTVGGAATGAAVGGAGGGRAPGRRRELDVAPAAEGEPREREQRR
jgi:hypothetical protein